MKSMILFCLMLNGIENCKKQEYEQGLKFLNYSESILLTHNQYHHQFYFYKSVAEYELMKYDELVNSSSKFYESFNKAPSRYDALIRGMLATSAQLPKELSPETIERKMNNVSRRLNLFKGDEETIRQQKSIVEDLDKLIKQQEQQANGGGQGKGDGSESEKPQQGDGNSPANGQQPATDSKVMGGAGKGQIDEKDLRKYQESWGEMTPEARARVVKELTLNVPDKYKQLTEDYFKSLNKIK